MLSRRAGSGHRRVEQGAGRDRGAWAAEEERLEEALPDRRGRAFSAPARGFVLGYTGEIAVSDDHLIVAQRVTQNVTDNASLGPMIDEVTERCGAPPARLADSGFFSIANIEQLEQQEHRRLCTGLESCLGVEPGTAAG